ncbi:uncharacterized protein LOC132717901 isoform X3 [Ruditapes philippinarum]|uniref:uncharacterized protein LOC132717901 isoform X3 n=1 Tax=Ruditapes philippinarum TaxID=129788 RepID=UPI00295C1775|nr:uncharacterized protein LOC132717901 isoform X3 [Ruditapes philippinarum]
MSNIRVALRVRPLNEKEKDQGSKEIVRVNKNSVRIENDKVLGIPEFGDSRSRIREFLFDHIYDCMLGENALSSQVKVFEDLGTDVLKAAFDGFNACVFAYGQTGTGKTHTMMGYPGDVGLIPRICEGLFTHMSECTDENLTSRIEVSYFEIYNERVRDLLQPEMFKLNENFSLKVREHPKDGPYVKDLTWHRVKTNDDIQTLLDKGNKYRVTAETYMHGHSSRSHAIVTVCYTQARLEENRPSEIVSKINLVDLAGSERADPSSKPDFRKRLTEGANINKSLVTLGYVIKALAERSLLSWSPGEMGSTQSFHSSGGGETGAGLSPAGPNKQRVPYIPYRDSVLTWLLRDSLGGNSKTIMIATITPASQYYSESISTLRYAQRAKNIINKPRINEDTNVALIRELRQEIERLHRMLATAQMPASHLGPSYLPGDIIYFVPDLHRGQDDPNDQQSGSMVTLQESEDAIIAEKLHENEEMAKQLTQSWMGKWSSTQDIMKESDLSIRGLHNQSSSMGVMIDSQLPYLIGMDDDVLSTGIVIFHLKEGDTFIGGDDADKPQDIVLHGPTIQKEHCVIRHVNGEVYLHPCPGSLCAVQDIECTEPIKLSQGDYVILGGNQTFRFNNPSEAAKLRENRRSQGSLNALNTSHLSFGGLSRASSYSSIGGDDSYYLSPPQLGRSYPNYAAPDLCRDLERRYQTEQERIAEASKELERLKAEHERAEELRQLKEEEMYMTHEQHRADIEDQKRHLLRLKEENERERAKAEEELRLARESLSKEKEAFQRKLEEERKALKALKKIEEQQESMAIQTDPLSYESTSVGCDPLSTQTMSVGSEPLSTHSVSTGSEQSSTATTSTEGDNADTVTDLPVKYKGGRRVSADDQLDDLAQTEFTRRMSYRETEESLAIQQEDMEDAYLQTQAQLEDKLRKLQKMEEEYKEVDKAHLQEMEVQTEKVREIRKQEVQLEVYIQESQELCNVREEKPQPLRTACSEMFLLDPSIQDQDFSQKTTSLLDIQGADCGEQLSPRSRRLRRSSSADSIESGISDISKDFNMDTERLKDQKDKKISSVAKQVTSRLYQAPEPKFKYVPKTKEKEIKTIPRTKVLRDRTTELKPRTGFDRTARVTKSESPQRVTGKRTSPAPSRIADIKKRPGSASQRDQKSKPGPKPKDVKDDKGKGDKHDRNALKVTTEKNKVQGPNRANSPSSRLGGALSPPTRQSGAASPPTRAAGAVSPTGRLTGSLSAERLGVSGSNIVRTSPLRQMASATSLASVPESVAENEESDMGEIKNEQNKTTSYVVKKRQKKGRANFIDDDFRCHSAPDAHRTSQALDDYTDIMNSELQTGISNSNKVPPFLTTSVSVDDSMVNTEEEMKTNDTNKADIENDINEMDIEAAKVNESNVELDNLDSDVEMKEAISKNGKPVHMYISSEEMSHESGNDMAEPEMSVNTDKHTDESAKMDLNENSILQNVSMETSESLVTENTDNVVLGKRERVDSEKSKDSEVPPKKSKSVSDITDNLCDTKSNDEKTGVNAETDNENFSEDSLDLNISIDSLEGEQPSDRLTQSLPAYIIRSEKPMSEDSLSDSCDEHNVKESDTKESNKEEQLSDVTPTYNENFVPYDIPHTADIPDLETVKTVVATHPTTLEIENIDNQNMDEDDVNTTPVNRPKVNDNEKDNFNQEFLSDLTELATDTAKDQEGSKDELDVLPSDEIKVENYISDIIKHAKEIYDESVKVESCVNINEDPKIQKLRNEDITNESGPELVCYQDKIVENETVVLSKPEVNVQSFNDNLNVTEAKSFPEMQQDNDNISFDDLSSHKDIEVNQKNEQKSINEPDEILSGNLISLSMEDGVEHKKDFDVVNILPTLEVLENKETVTISEDDSVSNERDKENSICVKEEPVGVEETNICGGDENRYKSDNIEKQLTEENEYKELEMEGKSIDSDSSDESESRDKSKTDTSRNISDTLKGATGPTNGVDKMDTSSDNEDNGEKKDPYVDENQNVVGMADNMGEYNRNLVDSAQALDTQNEDDLNMNLMPDSNGQEHMEEKDHSQTLENENSSVSEPAASGLLQNVAGNQNESSIQSDIDKIEDKGLDDMSGKDERPENINGSLNDSAGQPDAIDICDDGQSSDLKITNSEGEQQKDKSDIKNHLSPLIKTKSIGVGTSQDLMENLDVAATNQGSEDSFDIDPKEELQVLQEALESLPARSGPQLSRARLATRQRAMNRQQHRGGDSDGIAPLSDEAPISGTQTKNSNRPSSGSRRRKRPSNKSRRQDKQAL